MVKLPEPGNAKALPAGTYLVRIVSFEFGEAKTGTKQIVWKAEVEHPLPYAGRRLTEYTALTEKAIWKVSNLIGGCGIKFDPGKIDTDAKEFLALCNQAVGRTSMWLLTEEPDTSGVIRNNVVRFEQDDDQEIISFNLVDDSPFAEKWPE